MACVSPPELGDRTLLTYIDGEADSQVVAHVEQCPHCREKAHRLAHLQDRLTAQLYRLMCPPPRELGEFHLGLLPPAQASAVAQHLAKCPHCTRELAQLKDYLSELSPTLELGPLEQIKERLRVLVARLVSGGVEGSPLGPPSLAPAFAGVRGEEEEPRCYQAEDVQIVIGIQEDAGQPGHKVFLGLVMGMEPSGVKAHLWQAERLVTTVEVDRLGNFVVPGLAPGSYELILSGPEVEIHIQDLEVGPMR